MRPMILAAVAAALLAAPAAAQQIADPDVAVKVERPAFPNGDGPSVVIDAGHNNFHTVDGRFAPFAAVVRSDGFDVSGRTGPFTAQNLAGIRVLVIANALDASDEAEEDWTLPNPSPFTPEEIAVLKAWVADGGALLLIADHMPFAGAAEDLAGAFGFQFSNGFAKRAEPAGPDIFTRGAGLKADVITTGRDHGEAVTRIRTFTGSAFKAPADARPLIVFPKGYVSSEPRVAWTFDKDTTVVDAEGWLQGAALPYGKGRIAVFGEAAMFTAQLGGPQRKKIGFNAPDAVGNRQLLVNVVRWLAGVLPEQ